MKERVDRYFLAVGAAATVLAVLMVGWLAGRISSPLEELAGKAAKLDLDNLDLEFSTGRDDEIGKLSRVLDTMAGRLKKSAADIRDAERRATLGELARQVNHDIKNGLAPIRNIFRHLRQLAGRDPEGLNRAFSEREGSLESSISYLQSLASSYAGLNRERSGRRFAVNPVIRDSLGIVQGTDHISLETDLGGRPEVFGDPVSLQRIMENLLKNARDALASTGGSIKVSSMPVEDREGGTVLITVSDTGEGIAAGRRERIFEHFYSTREEGSGLGLSIVQRLVRDMNGSVDIESEEGAGTMFTVKIPMAKREGGS
jgi:signal transduction histidine kinase